MRRHPFRAVLLAFVLAASGCASRRSERPPGAGLTDTIATAHSAGIDYLKLTRKCLDRDKRALHQLFVFTRDGHLDAAAAQGHAVVLGELLRYLGDGFFGGVLSRE